MKKLLTIFRYVPTTWMVLRDRRTPALAKLATLAAFVYLVSPIDFVSDVLPVIGWIDDGLAMWLLPKLAFKMLPADMYAEVQASLSGQTIQAGGNAAAPAHKQS